MPGRSRLARVDAYDVLELDEGWAAAAAAPGACAGPDDVDRLDWMPAQVPGTAARALADAGREAGDLDAEDWWFRTRFAAAPAQANEQLVLRLDGVATVAEAYLNGERIALGESMFEPYEIDLGSRARAANELCVRCAALAPLLGPRRRPRARWRTRVVASGELRWYRTMLLGRAPGFAPGPAAVGPWRPVSLQRRRSLVVDSLSLRPRLCGDDGALFVDVRLRSLDGLAPAAVRVRLDGPTGEHSRDLTVEPADAGHVARGELAVPAVARWWPHTHGEPALYDARIVVEQPDAITIDAGRIGFRTLAPGSDPSHDIARDGLHLHVNDVGIFARGAVWTSADPVGLAPAPAQLRSALERARDAGMNMLRIPGTSAYEQPGFFDLCDELGILVWQDFMFANFDYPFADEGFRAGAEREARLVLDDLGGRPSVAVLCGNSEVEQQATMFGADIAAARDAFFYETLPALARESGADAAYVPSAPSGGTLPFRPDRGVANYYGVGGYRRELSDARLAGVRFAAECLAFANVPDAVVVDSLVPHAPSDVVVHHPRWKAGVPRDCGTGWDFDDVRDHYLATLFGVVPGELRSVDHERYLALSRAVTGEVMSEVFGEWRRSGSACNGGLVLWLRDLVAGAGWGVLDHRGEPKVAYHSLRRALAPIAVWTTDEGLGGVLVHVANERPVGLSARLRVSLYRDFEVRVGEASEQLELAPHAALQRDVEAMLGHFVDAAWAYRFGPPGHDVIVASLERTDGELLGQSFRFPAGRPARAESRARLAIEARAERAGSGDLRVAVSSRRLAYGVRLDVPGFAANDDAFGVEPGATRTVMLSPRAAGVTFEGGSLTALNLVGETPIAVDEEAG